MFINIFFFLFFSLSPLAFSLVVGPNGSKRRPLSLDLNEIIPNSGVEQKMLNRSTEAGGEWRVGEGGEGQKRDAQDRKSNEESIPLLGRTKCYKIPQSVEKTCYLEKIVQEVYDCSTQELEEICVEKKEKVPAICHRLKLENRSYGCPKERKKKVCVDIPLTRPRICSQKVLNRVVESCAKDRTIANCIFLTKKAPDRCIKVHAYTEQYECWKMESEQICETIPQNKLSVCDRVVIHQQPYDDDVEFETFQQCQDIEKKTNGTCWKEEESEEEYPCQKIQWKKNCQPIQKVNQKPCEKIKMQIQTRDCSEIITKTIDHQCTRRS